MSSPPPQPLLYALGSNGSGQLGIGFAQDVSIPREVLFAPTSSTSPTTSSSPSITRIAAGGNHTLLLPSNGHPLFSAGDNTTGATGPLTTPQARAYAAKSVAQAVAALPLPLPVTHIAATWEASVIVQVDAEHDGRSTVVSTFGAGQKGELAQGQFVIRSPRPAPLVGFPPHGQAVVDVAACVAHCVVVLDGGEVWGWGSGRKGQLGTGVEGVCYEPVRVEGLGFKAVRAVCGREFTAVFGSAESGEVVVLGADKAGVRAGVPERVVGWMDVGASWGGVYVLHGDGSLLSWGKDDHGQLAPPGLPKLVKIAVGSEHVVALTGDGDVISWGWGEHGNCGPQVENNDVKGRWNTIASKKYVPPGSEIVAIGAGCATSWISIQMASPS